MTVLRTDRKHASNCMTEENGVEKVKKRKNFFRSLRFRILIILIILGIVPGVIVTYTMLHNYQNRAVAMLTETVGDQCDILCNLIIRENYLNDTDSEVVNSKLELFSNVYNGRILLADRDFKIVSDTFHTEEGKTLLSSLAVAWLKGEETSNYDARSKVLELAVPVQSPDVQQLQGVMLVSVSAVDIAETLAEMEQRGVMLIGSIVVLSVFLAWLLSTILVKPLARVTKAIEDLTDGMLDEEISVPDYTEIELITDAFNKMVNRMKILDESRQEFVSNVSHELKTPLTSISGFAELMKEGMVPKEKMQEFSGDIYRESRRLIDLVDDIIQLSRLDEGTANFSKSPVDLYTLSGQVIESLRPVAQKQDITLTLSGQHAVIKGVEQLLQEMVYNLCDNAIKYNISGGSVTVSVWQNGQTVTLSVVDTGIGIPYADQSRVFERFYRVDKSHSKEVGGTGLGLSIATEIVQRHNGTLSLVDREGPGTTVRLELPIRQSEVGGAQEGGNG